MLRIMLFEMWVPCAIIMIPKRERLYFYGHAVFPIYQLCHDGFLCLYYIMGSLVYELSDMYLNQIIMKGLGKGRRKG